MSIPEAQSQVRRPQLLLVLLCSTQFLNTVNLSSVNIALPDIAAELRFSEANLPWVIAAYALTFGGFLLVGGRLADLVGRRKVLAVGFAIFGVFTLVDALATSPAMLIAARGLQGVGAAISIPASLGILTNAFTERSERSRAVAAFAAAGAVGFASGLVLGGIVTDALGWRWVFGLTVPPVVVLLALTFAFVPPDPAGSHAGGRVDLPGALTATTGLLGLVFALTNAGEAGWSAPTTLIALVTGITLLGLFLLLQAWVREPLMPLHLWRQPNFAAVMVIAFCLYACWVGMTYFLALTLQEVLGYSPTEAALALLPLTVGGVIGSTIAGRVLPRTGAKPLLVLGLSLYIAGIALAAFIDGDSTYWLHIFAAISLTAVGIPLAFVSSNVTALADAGPHEQSLLGGLFNTGVQVGGGLGLAVMSAVAATRIGRGDSGNALLPGYHAAFWTAVVIAALGLLIALFLVREPTAKAPVGGTTRASG